MAERNPPSWLQGGSHPADLDRMLTSTLLTAGVVGAGHLAVTEDDTVGMRVKVADGRAVIAGSRAPTQGSYHVVSDGPRVIDVPAADATNPRIDLVVARVRDASYDALLEDDWLLTLVPGTPAPSPAVPAAPEDSLILAQVAVGAGATGVTNANITDRRSRAVSHPDVANGLRQIVTFTSSGTFNKADYPWLRAVKARVQAGGGGGGGCSAGASDTSGGGGGGGGYAESLVPASDLAAAVAVTVGAGGGGAATGVNSGSSGGASSFGSHVSATGGSGGVGGGSSTSKITTPGGDGGTGTGQVTRRGNDGHIGRRAEGLVMETGKGGGSAFGSDRRVNTNNAGGNGLNGQGFGGGASAGWTTTSGADRGGGDGADGIVVVELYG